MADGHVVRIRSHAGVPRPAGAVDRRATTHSRQPKPHPHSISAERLSQLLLVADPADRGANTFPPAYPHGDLKYVGGRTPGASPPASPGAPADGVWTVRVLHAIGVPLATTPTMTIVRASGALTLFNALRLTPRGEAALSTLGPITTVVRLGGRHGADDEYYRRVHGAALAAVDDMRLADGAAAVDLRLTNTVAGLGDYFALSALPIPAAAVVVLPTPTPEAVVYLPHHGPPGGLLLTADALVVRPARRGAVAPQHARLHAAATRLGVAPAAAVRLHPDWWRAQVEGGVDVAALRAAYVRVKAWGAGGLLSARGDAWLPDGGGVAVVEGIAGAVTVAMPVTGPRHKPWERGAAKDAGRRRLLSGGAPRRRDRGRRAAGPYAERSTPL